MDKKEKYYQHIVKNLIYKTIVIEDEILGMNMVDYKVKFPWEFYNIGTDEISVNFVMGEITTELFNYLEKNYGTTSDDALTIIVKYEQTLANLWED